VRGLAVVSSLLAPVFFIGGTIAAELSWPQFDPVAQTISELAARDAPTQIFMTVMFVLTGVCHFVTALYARGLAWPVLSMRLSAAYPWLLRPIGATLSTLAVGAACVAFAGIEATPDQDLVGLAERVADYLESLWPAVVVAALYLRQRRDHTSSLS
jgi:hypothetical protein